MILATLSNFAALLISAALAFAIGLGSTYRAICRRDKKRRRLKRVFWEENWNWPEREAGPVSRTRLGRRP